MGIGLGSLFQYFKRAITNEARELAGVELSQCLNKVSLGSVWVRDVTLVGVYLQIRPKFVRKGLESK